MKDEPDLTLENEFYNAAIEAIEQNDLTKSLEEYGSISMSSILRYFKAEDVTKFEALEGVRGSKIT